MSDEPTEKLELRITKDLWDAIDRLAKKEGRHITSQARLLIERGLVKTAQPKPPPMRSAASLVPIAQRWGLDKPRKRPRHT
jgi:hypothetical protein